MLAPACGLTALDLHGTLKPQVVSTGLPFCIVPLRSLEALHWLDVRPELRSLLTGMGAKFIYAVAPAGEDVWRARMPMYGTEDPATGSAAGCAISYLVRHGATAPGSAVTLRQGVEVHRPSLLHARASLLDGIVTDVFVGGRTIPVASGLFTLP